MAGVQDADVQEVIDATKTMDLRRESQPSQVRPSIPSDQSAVLEAAFARNRQPSSDECEELAAQLGMSAQRVERWFQDARKRAAQRPPPSPSASVSSNEARRPSYDAAVSARSGNLFPLKQAPRKNPSKHDLHSIPTPMSPDGKGMLPPITHIPPISFGLDTPWEPSEPDVASLRTVGSGSSGGSRGGKSSGGGSAGRSASGPPRRASQTFPTLASVAGSSGPSYPGSPASSSDGLSRRNSVTSSLYSSQNSIAPTVSSSRPSMAPSRVSASTTSTSSQPQSIFAKPGHNPRPLTDLVTHSKVSRLFGKKKNAVTLEGSGGGRRAASSDILDAALATSVGWQRPIRYPQPQSRSSDILNAAVGRPESLRSGAASTYGESIASRNWDDGPAAPSPAPSRGGSTFPMRPGAGAGGGPRPPGGASPFPVRQQSGGGGGSTFPMRQGAGGGGAVFPTGPRRPQQQQQQQEGPGLGLSGMESLAESS